MNLPLDPHADPSRRAWIHCTTCPPQACDDCAGRRNCSKHYSLLIASKAWKVTLQCPKCGHMWTVDTARRQPNIEREASA